MEKVSDIIRQLAFNVPHTRLGDALKQSIAAVIMHDIEPLCLNCTGRQVYVQENLVKCTSCNIKWKCTMSWSEIREIVIRILNEHQLYCNGTADFFSLNAKSLYIFCEECGLINKIN